MKSITFNTGEFKVEKTSAWLVAFIKFAQTLGALELLEQVKVQMKKNRLYCTPEDDDFVTIRCHRLQVYIRY
jgi:hypothetical protein